MHAKVTQHLQLEPFLLRWSDWSRQDRRFPQPARLYLGRFLHPPSADTCVGGNGHLHRAMNVSSRYLWSLLLQGCFNLSCVGGVVRVSLNYGEQGRTRRKEVRRYTLKALVSSPLWGCVSQDSVLHLSVTALRRRKRASCILSTWPFVFPDSSCCAQQNLFTRAHAALLLMGSPVTTRLWRPGPWDFLFLSSQTSPGQGHSALWTLWPLTIIWKTYRCMIQDNFDALRKSCWIYNLFFFLP